MNTFCIDTSMSGQRPMSKATPSSRMRKYVSCPARERPSSVKCGVARTNASLSLMVRRSWCVERIDHAHELREGGHPRVGRDLQPMLHGCRDGGAARGQVEVHGAHATALGAVDVGVEVVADEDHLLVTHVESAPELFEDR